MRKIILTGIGAFLIGGVTTGAVLAQAQPSPTPTVVAPGPAMDGPLPHPGMMGWRHGFGHERPFNPRAFALIYRQPDRQLAPADVQKIVEGFLLWNGNHSWKVSNVAATADGPIGFSLATQEGSIVAKFTMDPHTGRIVRVG